ncbi:MAG TPA: ATP-dependent DNA helicase RecG, partial [Sphaerochaeta sp.]|nr:ATP-dependent DNA helicase RecG [Sphaerochaeta sp.]
LEKSIRVGRSYYLWAQVHHHRGERQSSQFEAHPIGDDGSMPPAFGKILPIYPLRGSLTQRLIRTNIQSILAGVDRFIDELPPVIRERHNLLDTDTAIRTYHFPSDLSTLEQAQRTLAFTELFYLQLATRPTKTTRERVLGTSSPTESELSLIEALPFSLTADQMHALGEIRSDISSDEPMNRLLQGDVGSGKTLVAWITALFSLGRGGQVAFMAPTELLARQHAEGAATLLAPLGVRLAFLTGSVKAKDRRLLLEAVANGEVDILIGTHALFSAEVRFKDLRYVIIDEQHRFGVEQRLALLEKATIPDLLLMTATPIPRTLSLTVFGNLDISTLKTMPAGRKPVITHLVSEASRSRMYQAVGVEFTRGHQAYFVYPRIDDTGTDTLRDVTGMYEYLQKQYPGVPSALMHSRLSEDEKIAILHAYQKGELSYLVSTSVVEVGIDIPNATCMIVEHAERFGLSALHQLRGRVGRSTLQSYCFLVFSNELTEDAKSRLRVLKESNDGFYIAEQDLLIRGPGEVAGTRQSGYLRLTFASLTEDLELIQLAREEADLILLSEAGLLGSEHTEVRETLTYAPYFDLSTTEL